MTYHPLLALPEKPKLMALAPCDTHDRHGRSAQPHHNGLFTHPQDLDAPLRIFYILRCAGCPAQRKINDILRCARTTTTNDIVSANNQNISFLPAILSTSTRTASFCVSSFYRLTARPRRTSLPSECRHNNTATRFAITAQHSTTA